MTLISRLEKYCLTPAMAGFEDEMIKSLKADLSEYADEVRVDVLGNVGGLHTWSVCLLLDEELDIDPEDTLPTSLTSDLTLCLTSWLVLGGVVGADAGAGGDTGTVVGVVTRTLVEAAGATDGVGDTTTVTFRVWRPLSQSFAK